MVHTVSTSPLDENSNASQASVITRMSIVMFCGTCSAGKGKERYSIPAINLCLTLWSNVLYMTSIETSSSNASMEAYVSRLKMDLTTTFLF